jgi:hypothetical protein
MGESPPRFARGSESHDLDELLADYLRDPDARPAYAQQPRIVVIEPGRETRRELCEMLEQAGHVALGVPSPDAAMVLMKSQPFDLVVTGPGCDGRYDPPLPMVVVYTPVRGLLFLAAVEDALRGSHGPASGARSTGSTATDTGSAPTPDSSR